MRLNDQFAFDGVLIHPWPEDPDTFVCSRQVAWKLGYKTMRTFWADKQWLEQRGFPPPPLKRRWRAGAILAWLKWRESGAGTPANDAAPADAPAPYQESATDILQKLKATRAG